ncbi:MAG: amidohydrolase family protein, partial [Chloroflexi bacterium]|nr:amidohydrolase family protein [Chloroflexota bacterium]
SRFRQLVRLAARYNLRVNTLVRNTLEEVLSVFEEVHEETPIDSRRWALDHVLHATPEQLKRISRLGLVVETIPLTELWQRGFRYVDDPQLADDAAAHRRYLQHGVHFGFGTDNKPYNPFVTLWSAVARRERRTNSVLGPEQRLSRMEALRVFTVGGAYFSFDEDRRGSLEPGKLADLAVLSDDLLSMPEEKLPELRSLFTMVGGKVVHQTDDLK